MMHVPLEFAVIKILDYLQVPMNHWRLPGMQIMQPLQNLPAPISQHLRLDGTLGLANVRFQGAAGHELGDEVDLVAVRARVLAHPGVKEVDDGVMPQLLEDLNFGENFHGVLDYACTLINLVTIGL
jgi:hypothetical protein